MPVNIAVLVSGGGTNLQALLDAEAAGALTSGRIRLVVSNRPGVYALERAKQSGIAALTLESKRLGAEAFENALMQALGDYGIELVILAGFMRILSRGFTERYERRILNVHPSLIPSFCGEGYYGLKVHEAALQAGVKVTGATVHYVNHITDGGEILMQKAVEVRPDDTPERLQRRVMEEAEWQLLPRAAEEVSKRLSEEKGESI